MQPEIITTPSQHLKSLPTCALREFRNCMSCGRRHHNEKKFALAVEQFQNAKQISQLLIEQEPSMGYQCYLKLLIATHHNLAASYSAMGRLKDAEEALRVLHDLLLNLCQSHEHSRHLRSEALAALDNSLFALTNILGLQGKLCQLFATIADTDRAAEQAAMDLLH